MKTAGVKGRAPAAVEHFFDIGHIVAADFFMCYLIRVNPCESVAEIGFVCFFDFSFIPIIQVYPWLKSCLSHGFARIHTDEKQKKLISPRSPRESPWLHSRCSTNAGTSTLRHEARAILGGETDIQVPIDRGRTSISIFRSSPHRRADSGSKVPAREIIWGISLIWLQEIPGVPFPAL